MGIYSSLNIDGQPVWDEMNAFVPGMDVLFTDEDWFEDHTSSESASMADEAETSFGFSVPLRIARFRLGILGYTLSTLEQEYDKWDTLRHKVSKDKAHHKIEESFYGNKSFDEYMNLLRLVHEYEFDLERLPKEARYIVFCPSLHPFAFPSEDELFALAANLYAVTGQTVELDLTDMAREEWWQRGESLESWQDGRLILVTEGRSDNLLLDKAMSLLDPKLASEGYALKPTR